VHDAFNTELIGCRVEDQMLVEGTGDLKTTDASKLWRLKMAADAQVGVTSEALNRLIHCPQITPGHFHAGILNIPPELRSKILLRSLCDDDRKAY